MHLAGEKLYSLRVHANTNKEKKKKDFENIYIHHCLIRLVHIQEKNKVTELTIKTCLSNLKPAISSTKTVQVLSMA